MSKLYTLICLSFLLNLPLNTFAQCTFNNFFNSSVVLSGSTVSNVACVQGGQYVSIQVTAGETYLIETCGSASGDSQITLFDASNTTVSVGYNDDNCGLLSSITYVATFTGTLYIQVNEYFCATSTTCYSLNISCTSCSAAGSGCSYVLDLFDSYGDGWDGSTVDVSINGTLYGSYTVTASSNSVSFTVNNCDVVTLSFVDGGGIWNSEVSYFLYEQPDLITPIFSADYSTGTILLGPVFNTTCGTGCGGASSTNVECDSMAPICTTTGVSFTAQTSGTDANTANPGPDYDCLGAPTGSAPDPTYWYFEISQAGDLDLSLTAPADIDFIIWGPFTDTAAAIAACGVMGDQTPPNPANGSVIDCSYSATNLETPFIPGAQVGEVYVMMVTNYAGVNQQISLTQVGGSGATNCSIVVPCNADAGTVSTFIDGVPSTSPLYVCFNSCIDIVSDSNYTLPTPNTGEESELMYAIYTGIPNLSLAPDVDPNNSGLYWTGDVFNDCNDASSIILGAGLPQQLWFVPITMDDGDNNGNPNGVINYDNNGDSCWAFGTPIEIIYLDEITAIITENCATNTTTFVLSGGLPGVLGTGSYTVVNTGAGTMVQSGVNGEIITFSGYSVGQTLSISVTDDGNNCTATFSYITTCIGCNTTAGTVSVNMSNTTANNYVLCYGDSIEINSNGNYVLPPAADVSGLGYAIYACPPTTGDPDTDPCFTGWYWNADSLQDANYSGSNLYDFILNNPQPGFAVVSGNILYYVPITMDDIRTIASGGLDDNFGHDIDGDGCFVEGTTIPVLYLNEITFAVTELCVNGSPAMTIVINGGYPEFDSGSSYTIVNTGSGTLSQSGAQGDTIIVSGLNAGQTVSFSVTNDGNSCGASFSQVSTFSVPTITLDSTIMISCFGANDGAIYTTLNSSNVASYNFFLNMFDSYGDGWNGGSIDVLINGVSIGTFAATGFGSTGSFSANPGDAVVLIYSSGIFENENSYTLSLNGSIVFSDGPPPATGTVYTFNCPPAGTPTYTWTTGATTDDITGLGAGSYSLIATDGYGCSTSLLNVSVTEPSQLIVSADSTSQSSCLGNTGAAYISVSGGTAGYSFIWSNGSTTEDISGLAAGTYDVTVTDNNGCTATSSLTVTQVNGATVSAAITSNYNGADISCFGANDGSATATPSGGTSPFTYIWSNGETGATATTLGSGTATVTITDVNSCTATATVVLTEPTLISVVGDSTTDASCTSNTGAAYISVSGGTPTYNFVWSDGSTSEDASALASGNYTVIVSDANGCVDSLQVFVGQVSTLVSSASVSSNYNGADVSCAGSTDGEITATGTSGTPPYTYIWSDGQTTATATGLAAGIYTVTVYDNAGCFEISTDTVFDPNQLVVTVDSTADELCGGSDGYIYTSSVGGTGILSYSWGAGQTSSSLVGLTSGNYTLTVSDQNSCLDSISVFVGATGGVSIFMDSMFNVNCNGNATGSIYLSDSSTVGCFSSSVVINEIMANPSGPNDGVDPNTSEYIELLGPPGADISCYVLTDGDWSITIPSGTTIPADGLFTIGNDVVYGAGTFDLDAENCGCFVDGTGGSGLLIFTNSGEYLAMFDNTGTFVQGVQFGSSPSAANTAPNGGTVVGGVMPTAGLSGCVASVTIPGVGSFESIPTNPIDGESFSRNPDGSGTWVTQSGGTLNACNFPSSGVNYIWSNGDTTQDITGLTAGVYTVTATDGSGCITSSAYTVTEPSLLTVGVDSTLDNNCNGDLNGAVFTSYSGGSGSYTYLWSNGETTDIIVYLNGGTYSVTVTDSLGCTDTISATILEPDAINLATDSTNNVLCFGDSTGNIFVSSTGGTLPYNWTWSNGSTTASNTNLIAGAYSVTMTDANGCSSTSQFTLTEPTQIILTDVITNVSCDSTDDGTISITANGGVPGYFYQWDAATGSQTTATATGLASNAYGLTVTDANGCTVSGNGYFVSPSIPVDSNDVPVTAIQGVVDCDFNPIGILAVNTTGTYSYLWSNGSTDRVANSLGVGPYSVTITNGLGCSIVQTGTIGQPFVPSVNPFIVTSPQVSATITTGDSAFISGGNDQSSLGVSYEWTSPADVDINDLFSHETMATSTQSGSYILTITATAQDSNACVDTGTVVLNVEAIFAGMPDAFTPDGDGLNDLFRPVGLQSSEVIEFKVYNRFGGLVYNGDGLPNGGWDGTLNGVAQPAEGYIYMLKYNLGGQSEDQTIRGQVILLR